MNLLFSSLGYVINRESSGQTETVMWENEVVTYTDQGTQEGSVGGDSTVGITICRDDEDA
jgi:hypothetical protein